MLLLTPFSGVTVTPDAPMALSSFTELNADFTDISGGAFQGSPRFVLRTSDPNSFYSVYLGPTGAGSFTHLNPVTFTAAYSGFNLINGTSDSAFGNSGSYVPFSSLSGGPVTRIDFIVDGPAQALNLSGVSLNGTFVPVPGPVVGAGLPGLAIGVRRPSRLAAAAEVGSSPCLISFYQSKV